ncbi:MULTISPECIES: hypothetical protein [Natrialbaceae]|uniref:hypothetical protein n=1 Tax=Natrialbaceae TaxID=1644061 RepID=UPI00207D1538|nr:hypothetical protein [Natronococcus sp. CG52]
MNRRQILSAIGGFSVAPAGGCLWSNEERTDAIVRDVREFLESESASSDEILVLSADEVEESEFHPGGVSVGLRHVLPFTTDDDPAAIRDAVDSNSYHVADACLERTDEILRIEINSYVRDPDKEVAPEVSYVHLRWDALEEVDWTAIGPADVPDSVTRYWFDETPF